MKKNKFMRFASLLLIATLLTTSVISGTFAKYTTEDKASDFARVAKWGVELQVVGNLYGDTYANKQLTNTDNQMTVQSSNTTESADGDAVVAPGTDNDSGFTFRLNGTPEVDSNTKVLVSAQNIFLKKNQYGMMIPVPANVVTAANWTELRGDLFEDISGTYTRCTSATFDDSKTYYTLEDWVNLTEDYYPVVYQLSGSNAATTQAYTDTDGYVTDTLNAIALKLAKAVKSDATLTTSTDGTYYTFEVNKKNETNQDLDTNIHYGDTKLTWAWKFQRDGDAIGDAAGMHDRADTILGNMIAAAKNTGANANHPDTEGIIVYAANSATEGNSFKAVVYATGAANIVAQGTNITAYNYVKSTASGTTADIACLDTQFSIDIIVTQVD